MSARQATDGNVYYDVTIPHNDQESVAASPTIATFTDTRTTALFNGKASDYTISVMKLVVPTDMVPLQVFPILPDQPVPPGPDTRINNSVYTVTLSWNGIDEQKRIVWTPELLYAQPPPSYDLVYNPQFVDYYSLFSVQHFVNMINIALNQAYVDIKLSGSPVIAPPFMVFNPAERLFTFYIGTDYNTGPQPTQIYFNSPLAHNFGFSFLADYIGFGEPNGKDVRYYSQDTVVNRVSFAQQQYNPVSPYLVNYFAIQQEYETLFDMMSFSTILVKTQNLPVRNEWISLQDVDEKTGQTRLSNSNFIKLIEDIEITWEQAWPDLRSVVTYNPTGEFRRVTLQGNEPINTIDVQVFWRDNRDNIYPLKISAHNVVRMKLLFEKIKK